DLALLYKEIKRIHYDPFRKTTREQFDAYVKKLHEDIPKLSDNQIIVGFIKLAQMAGDGHTHVRPGGTRKGLPIQLFQFEEGVFVTAAAPEYEDLAGAQILKTGSHSTAEVLEALKSVVSRDNEHWLKTMSPEFMRSPMILNGLGLIPDGDKATLTVRDAAG